jgi:hypothetical protein
MVVAGDEYQRRVRTDYVVPRPSELHPPESHRERSSGTNGVLSSIGPSARARGSGELELHDPWPKALRGAIARNRLVIVLAGLAAVMGALVALIASLMRGLT